MLSSSRGHRYAGPVHGSTSGISLRYAQCAKSGFVEMCAVQHCAIWSRRQQSDENCTARGIERKKICSCLAAVRRCKKVSWYHDSALLYDDDSDVGCGRATSAFPASASLSIFHLLSPPPTNLNGHRRLSTRTTLCGSAVALRLRSGSSIAALSENRLSDSLAD